MPLPAAASVSVARVLTGPVRAVTVTASLPTALYVNTFDPDTPAVCLAATDAVRVPCALVLGPGVAVPTAAVGSRAWLGEGQLRVAATSAVVTRWWRPARPRLNISYAVPVAIPCRSTTPELMDLAAPAAAVGEALTSGSDLQQAVRALLGRGPGLTPLGDDVLAGVLVTLNAAGCSSAVRRLGGVLAPRLGTATTPVSAALLAHAARGECIPQLAAVLEGAPGATGELLRVGHSSGSGLLLGVRIGLAALEKLNQPADCTPHRIGRSAE